MQMVQAKQSRKSRVPSNGAHIELSLPRKRAGSQATYMRGMASGESAKAMVYWVAEAAREAREEARRKQVHIAAGMDMDQSAVARFEEHANQPRDLDKTIAAYAEDLDIDPRQLWARALEMWIAAEAPAPAAAARGLQAVAQIAKRAAGKQAPTRKKKEAS